MDYHDINNNEVRSTELYYFGNDSSLFYSTNNILYTDVNTMDHELSVVGKSVWYTEPTIPITYHTKSKVR